LFAPPAPPSAAAPPAAFAGYPAAGYLPQPTRRTNTGLVVGLVAAGVAAAGVIAIVIVLATRGGGTSTVQTVSNVSGTAITPAVTPVSPSGGVAANADASGSGSVAARSTTSAPSALLGSNSASGSNAAAEASAAAGSAARRVVAQEWGDINSGNYAEAFVLFVPGSLGSSESSFISAHQQYAPISASVTVGNPVFNSSTDATVPIISLQTNDSSGCKNWSGSYAVQNVSGRWLINRANISSTPC
jgi:hypothetical protein